ncbi:MAG: DinB family protein [Caldilineaceae bacterium]|nr:DinB family protein [Caldilineaceae bacterium]
MLTAAERSEQITKLRRLPNQLRKLVERLGDEQLTTRYLAKEWTVAQNVHHLADAHMNAFILIKLMLSEEDPPLKGYSADSWASMVDADHADIELSLCIVENLNVRMVQLFDSLQEKDFARGGVNARGEQRTIDDDLRIYGNHGEAHLDQIQRTLAAEPKKATPPPANPPMMSDDRSYDDDGGYEE